MENEESKDIQTVDSENISIVLSKLSSLMERSISIMEQNRKMAISNYDYFKKVMESTHLGQETISEDGVMEKACNDAMKLVIDSAKVMEGTINTLSKILTAKMHTDAIRDSVGAKPVDLERFRKIGHG